MKPDAVVMGWSWIWLGLVLVWPSRRNQIGPFMKGQADADLMNSPG